MNFFKSMYNVNKLAKTIKKECVSLYEPLSIKSDYPTEESIVQFNDVLLKALSFIDVAEIDPDFKDSFRINFLGRTFLNLGKKYSTLSGNEIWKLFGWSPRIYKDMIDGAIGK